MFSSLLSYYLFRYSIPDNPNWQDPWTILTGNGTLDFLEIIPSDNVPNSGTYRWTSDHSKGEQAAMDHFVSLHLLLPWQESAFTLSHC